MGTVLGELLARVAERQHLSLDESRQAMDEIMRGAATPAQVAGYITALRVKGETVEEIAGAALSMQAHAHRVPVDGLEVLDTAGTGGDGSQSFNISTAAAVVIAAAGVPVAKHGNRSISSRCGSADVLEALGVAIELTPDEAARSIAEVGFGFCFAPSFHEAMRHAAGVRRELGIRTVFNLMGPLTNPANAPLHLAGVYDPRLTTVLCEVFHLLGARRAMVVHGAGGMDELSLAGPNVVAELVDGEVRQLTLDAAELGLPAAPVAALRGGGPAENAAILEAVLAGEPGPRRDAVLLNAGAALYVAESAESVREGIERAARAIDSGEARARLEALREFSARLRRERSAESMSSARGTA